MRGIELRVEPLRFFEHERFDPSLGRGAIERMLRIARERAAMQDELPRDLFERGRRLPSLAAPIAETEQDSFARPPRQIPARERKHRDFARSRHESHSNVIARTRHMHRERVNSPRLALTRRRECRFDFAPGSCEPALRFPGTRMVPSFESARVSRGIRKTSTRAAEESAARPLHK